ncbi:GerAB/ArcD/ProY family transporter [Effusibacillus consociatus]|uniref:GerAB/ArcD/ProY family transporter n=1 Tax=Effusibacillus consociatus TaxID=1117041 RepID=A0ABV9Q5E4_9BACL
MSQNLPFHPIVLSTYEYFRISIADFLEHLESIVMAVWVAGAFVKISVFYYLLSLGTAQWLGLSNYRPLVLPLGIYIIVYSILVAPNLQELSSFLRTTNIPFNITITFAIPLLLLIVALIRKKADVT